MRDLANSVGQDILFKINKYVEIRNEKLKIYNKIKAKENTTQSIETLEKSELQFLENIIKEINFLIKKKTTIKRLFKEYHNLKITSKEVRLIMSILDKSDMIKKALETHLFSNGIIDLVKKEYSALKNKDYKTFNKIYSQEIKLYSELDKHLNSEFKEEMELLKLEHKQSYLSKIMTKSWVSKVSKAFLVLVIIAQGLTMMSDKLDTIPKNFHSNEFKKDSSSCVIAISAKNASVSYIENLFVAEAGNSKKISVVARDETTMKAVIDELTLQQSDLFDQKTTTRMGKYIGASITINVKVTDSTDSKIVTINAVDLKTKTYIGKYIGEFSSEKEVYNFIKKVASKFAQSRN